jgi:uncharacterized protein YbaR (Trm112 family)
VFIELTDLLRCPADHAESFLVLLPDEMRDRFVRRGRLGCPVCHREFAIEEGIPRFGLPFGGGPAVPASSLGDPVDAAALQAFLGVEGPGGYGALVGSAARFAPGLRALLPGVHWVVVNAPLDAREQEGVSSLEAPLIPVLSRSLRGVVLGQGYGENSYWEAEAARVVLPGLRVVGMGIASLPAELELLADAGGWWVGKKR